MSTFDLLLVDAHVATMSDGYGAIRDAAVGIRGDRIAWVGPRYEMPRDARRPRCRSRVAASRHGPATQPMQRRHAPARLALASQEMPPAAFPMPVWEGIRMTPAASRKIPGATRGRWASGSPAP